MDRCSFLNSTAVLGGAAMAVHGLTRGQTAPAVITRDAMRPQIAWLLDGLKRQNAGSPAGVIQRELQRRNP